MPVLFVNSVALSEGELRLSFDRNCSKTGQPMLQSFPTMSFIVREVLQVSLFACLAWAAAILLRGLFSFSRNLRVKTGLRATHDSRAGVPDLAGFESELE